MNADDAFHGLTNALMQQAVGLSMLTELPPSLRQMLLADAFPVDVPAGGVIYRDEDDPRCALVMAGLVRVVLSSPDGRTVTVRYARTGELLGVPTVVLGPAPVSAQMVTDAQLLMLNPRALGHLGKTEPEIGWLLAREVARRLYDTLDAVADNAFGSLRQRAARHLLDLASTQSDGRLTASVSQQELADAVGSARPAVARVVAELRTLGVIETASRGIVILDAEGLHAQTWSQAASPE